MKLHALRVPNQIVQFRQRFQIYVEYPAAADASHVVMFHAVMVKTIGSARDLQLADLAFLRKDVEIAIDGPLADPRVLLTDIRVDLVRSRMVFKASHCLESDVSLDRVSSFHTSRLLLGSILNQDYMLIASSMQPPFSHFFINPTETASYQFLLNNGLPYQTFFGKNSLHSPSKVLQFCQMI